MNRDIKDIFEDFDTHMLNDEKPSSYFNRLIEKKEFPGVNPYSILLDLKKIDQSLKYHPEGNVWNHTMMVVDNAAYYKKYSQNKKVFMWAAMLHDIGKISTTKMRKGRITAYNHDNVGADLSQKFLKMCIDDTTFIDHVSNIIRWHMQPLFVVKNLPFTNLKKMIEEVSPIEIGLFSICDRLGRGELTKEKEDEEKNNIMNFLKVCHKNIKNDNEKTKIENMIEIIMKEGCYLCK